MPTNNPHQIAELLKHAQIPILSVSPITEEVDGAIQIAEDIHVQVGESYLSLVEEHNEIFIFGKVHSVSDLVAKLKAKLAVPIWARKIIGTSAYILSLKDNYDDEGAIAPTKDTYNRAIEFFKKEIVPHYCLFIAPFGLPEISHGPNGSIDFHWRQSHWDLLINFPVSGTPQFAGFPKSDISKIVKGDFVNSYIVFSELNQKSNLHAAAETTAPITHNKKLREMSEDSLRYFANTVNGQIYGAEIQRRQEAGLIPWPCFACATTGKVRKSTVQNKLRKVRVTCEKCKGEGKYYEATKPE